jgi:UDP-N-acetylmuramoylalanine--D-glutamate ligase
MVLEELKNKKILILGFGREGQDSYLALRKLFPQKVLAIADKLEFKNLPKNKQKLLKSDKKLKLYFGKNYLKSLPNYDLIIKTPGIPLKTIKPFLKKNTKITSQTEIFFENCPGTIVGVTGTKGKGTTCALISQILKERGLKVHLVGNIGKPVFQLLLKAKNDEIFVYELSSHQLQNLKKSPQIAVFLNLYPCHLDYYKNFQEYKKAKENITKYQTEEDFLIYNAQQKELREIAKISKAKKIPINPTNHEFRRITNKIKKNPLIGKFNLFNIMAAFKVGKIFGISEREIIKAIEKFKPLPHRLEFVGKFKGIEFYNDSLATVPQATRAAIEGLGEKVKTLILGGSDNKVSFTPLVKEILKRKIRNLIFLSPGTGEKIWQEIRIKSQKKKKVPVPFFVLSMEEAVRTAFEKTKKGEICLLSPGSPSFNLFRDYRERGNLFKKFVRYYGSK